MIQSYRKAYLTDGTQVKITEELFQQLKQWEQEGYAIPFAYSDMLKKEDDDMINANRRYYRHNIPLDVQDADSPMLRDTRCSLDDHVLRRELSKQVINVLGLCSETQRRRFIKHYYLGFSYSQIAYQEKCTKRAIEFSIRAAEKMLINCEQTE